VVLEDRQVRGAHSHDCIKLLADSSFLADELMEVQTMASKLNCWEFKKCGREPGGLKVAELGVCPAPQAAAANQVNGGRNGGRLCWALTGTFCGGKVQGTFAQKLANCGECEFYKLVRKEEGATLVVLPR